MNKTLYVCLFLVMLQFINFSSVYGQANIYSPKKGGFMISIDDTPASDADISSWELYRVLQPDRLMRGKIENRNKLQIPLNSLPKGIYVITLRSDSSKIGLKFTKS